MRQISRANLLRWELRRERAGTLLVCGEHPGLHGYDETSDVPPERIEAVLGSESGIARETAERLGGKPWVSLRVRDPVDGNEAGMYLDPRVEADCAVEWLDRNYRRGAYGLPGQRQTLMLESKWRPGDSLPLAAISTDSACALP